MTVEDAAAYWSASPTPDPSDPHHAVRWATLAEGWQPPSTDELRGLLKAAGWSQQAAGRLAGFTGRTARNWCSGATPIPYAAWFVLRETYLEQAAVHHDADGPAVIDQINRAFGLSDGGGE